MTVMSGKGVTLTTDSAPTIDRLEGDTSQNCESTRLWHAIGERLRVKLPTMKEYPA